MRRPGRCRSRHRSVGRRTLPRRYDVALLRAAAEGRSGPLHRRARVRPLLVGDQVQRHHGRGHQPRRLLLRRRDHHRQRAGGFPPADVHRHGPAQARRSAQDGQPDRRAPQPGAAGAGDPRAGQRDPRRAADRRDLQLGRSGLDRAHHPDAGHPVRFPLGRSPQADPLERRGHRQRRKRDRRERRGAPGRADGMRRLLHEPVERAGERAAAQRPHLHAGARTNPPATCRRRSSSAISSC